jgi:RNA polymerase sigma-70 factor (ECF subfamily)
MAEDATVLDRLRAGDTGALETLMSEYATRVFRLAFGITRNSADAEEVVQDVFFTVFTRHESFEGRSALTTWMYRITANKAINKRRGKRHEVETSLETMLEGALPTYLPDGHREGPREFVRADWSPTPEREALSGEARAVLSRAIDNLPANYRAVLVLRDVEELSNEEVADILGESVASVKSRLHRARMALREQLTRYFTGAA